MNQTADADKSKAFVAQEDLKSLPCETQCFLDAIFQETCDFVQKTEFSGDSS